MSAPADDFLEHFGVPGMKWGKHKSGGSSGSAKSAKATKPDAGGTGKNGKVTSGDIHLARYRQDLRGRKMQEAQAEFYVARTNKGQDKAEKIMRKAEKTYFSHPDAAMSAKMTRGEKISTGIVLGLVAATAALTVAESSRISR